MSGKQIKITCKIYVKNANRSYMTNVVTSRDDAYCDFLSTGETNTAEQSQPDPKLHSFSLLVAVFYTFIVEKATL